MYDLRKFTNYQIALAHLFYDSELFPRAAHFPKGDERETAITYYIVGVARASGKQPHFVGGDYRRFLMEIDESLVDKTTIEILKGRPCVMPQDFIEDMRIRYKERKTK